MGLGYISGKLGPRSLPVLGLALLCLIVGTLGYLFMHQATQRLLEAEARIDARRWSSYFSSNFKELGPIAAGVVPSLAARDYLKAMRSGGYLVSFRVYDTEGFLKLQSRDEPVASPVRLHISAMDPRFAAALAARQSATLLHGAASASRPGYFASSLVPIRSGPQNVGWLLVTFDQTERQKLLTSITGSATLAVCLLLIAGPVFGFWYRARNKAILEKTLVDYAKRDQFTGFMTKAALLELAGAGLDGGQPSGLPAAMILCELTDSAMIARGHGQGAEEAVIHRASERLSAIIAGKADIATAGRGAFLVFLAEIRDPMTVLSLAKDITLALGAEVEYDGMRLSCHCHSGIALTSPEVKSAPDLLRNAEMALISARDQGTPGYGFYNPDLAQEAKRRLAISRAVAVATEQKLFRLDFQPVYNIRTGELNGFEALIRLHDAELGHVSPAEFIPIAEQIGLINQIGAWALDEACRVAALWPAHLMVAVNLSPSQFMSGTLIHDVRRALTNNHYPSYRLEVEITEGTLMNDSELVMSQLRVLRDMGVAVALDDFGTGYSSLGYLWKFPFSKLKIDRSFVQALDESASAKGILRSIVKLGHGLGLTVTAEGIENPKQLSTLRDLGCDLAQGYLLDRPARVSDLAAIILRNFANGLNRRAREAGAGKTAA